MGGPTDQYKLEKATFALLRILASIGKVILIGRAGACATDGCRAGFGSAWWPLWRGGSRTS